MALKTKEILDFNGFYVEAIPEFKFFNAKYKSRTPLELRALKFGAGFRLDYRF